MCQNCRRSYNLVQGRRWFLCILFTGLWLVFSNVPALAHKVMIFAWVEGDTVYTQSKFSGGRKAKNSTVVVYDNEGNQLLEGKTDKEGQFSFKVPRKTDLKIVLKGSMGHMAEWNIPAEQITGQGDVSWRNTPEVKDKAATKEAVCLSTDVKTSRELPVPAAVGLSRQDIQDLIDESLDRKLAPIVTMLADPLDRGPRLTDVIGGIGYIFGLVGVALYFANRRKKQ